MSLRGFASRLEEKMVGRRGIEPRTSGLKVPHLFVELQQKTPYFPLSLWPKYRGFNACFLAGLRGSDAVSGES